MTKARMKETGEDGKYFLHIQHSNKHRPIHKKLKITTSVLHLKAVRLLKLG